MITTVYKNQIFEIVEDMPEVGFYLYVYDSQKKCIYDSLQNTEQSAKEIAFEIFGVSLKSWYEKAKVICCFCGKDLSFTDAIEISIIIDKIENETQAIYSHRNCLKNVLHKSIPVAIE